MGKGLRSRERSPKCLIRPTPFKDPSIFRLGRRILVSIGQDRNATASIMQPVPKPGATSVSRPGRSQSGSRNTTDTGQWSDRRSCHS